MKNKVVSVLCGAFLIWGIYLLITLILKQDTVRYINTNAGVTKGIVTGKHPDDKHSISVRYHIDKLIIDAIDEIQAGTEVNVGDSILIRYSVDKPDLIITEYNKDF